MGANTSGERRLYRWLADHARAVDIAIAAVFGVLTVGPYLLIGLVGGDSGVLWLALLGFPLAAPLAWRRSRPVPAAAVMLVACAIQLAFAIEIVAADLAVLIMIAALAAHAPR